MIGYSTDHGPAELHPTGCTCTACIDVANVEQDVTATPRGWIEMRRINPEDEARAEAMIKAARGHFPTLKGEA